MPSRSWTAARYQRRDKPAYAHQPTTAHPKQWQPDVYIAAAAAAKQLGAARIIDIGCGNGSKTIELSATVPTIGIDFGANLDRARHRAPDLEWREHDLQSDRPLPLSDEELAKAIVINADVIEHLPDPAKLLAMFRHVAPRVELILMSTPERHLTRGLRDPGPPSNPAHIQEWTVREFGALLREAGLPTHSLGLIRSHDHSDAVATILAAIASTEQRLRDVDRLLIDLDVPASKGRLRRLLGRGG